MARRMGLRTLALASFFGGAAAVAEIVHRTMHLTF
ncbi:MAG: hypothetical protein QOK25_2885 [Thermoleophilaceae bacterium]|jgi:hypothetical protein|nr:hypothetical protein [Thermoleophilaceae bacterium]